MAWCRSIAPWRVDRRQNAPCWQPDGGYGGHFHIAMRVLHETDDLRILDFNGKRAFRLFQRKALRMPIRSVRRGMSFLRRMP